MKTWPTQARLLLWCWPALFLTWVFGAIGTFTMAARSTTPGIGFMHIGLVMGSAIVLSHLHLPLLYAIAVSLAEMRRPAARAMPWPRKAMLWILLALAAATMVTVALFGLVAGPWGWMFAAAYASLFGMPVIAVIALLAIIDGIRTLWRRRLRTPVVAI